MSSDLLIGILNFWATCNQPFQLSMVKSLRQAKFALQAAAGDTHKACCHGPLVSFWKALSVLFLSLFLLFFYFHSLSKRKALKLSGLCGVSHKVWPRTSSFLLTKLSAISHTAPAWEPLSHSLKSLLEETLYHRFTKAAQFLTAF